MGRHKEWRKMAKKFMRKRIRKKQAVTREEYVKKERELLKACPRYQAWLKEQEMLDDFAKEEEERVANQARIKWEADEASAQIEWRRKRELAKQEAEIRERQQALIRIEWEKEQQKILEERQMKEREEKEKQEEYERLMAEMDLFISGQLRELPPELNVSVESQPGQVICPFFQKVGACRFKNSCSRNHIRPGISKCILIPGFYTHFSLSSNNQAEYDTDISLEYENHEQYKHFLEFYEDIKEEFLKFGKITVLKVCSNEELHLRGNVYVQFTEERSAMAAFRGLNGRFYAGRRISVQFVTIPNWKRAICGLQFRRTCPKGKVCNFLHVFRNPHGEYTMIEDNRKHQNDKDWKWSDSDSDSERNHDRKRRKSEERQRRERRKSRRSRSREKRRSRSKEYKRSKRKRSKEKSRTHEKERKPQNGS